MTLVALFFGLSFQYMIYSTAEHHLDEVRLDCVKAGHEVSRCMEIKDLKGLPEGE